MNTAQIINRLNQLGPWKLIDVHRNAIQFIKGCREYQIFIPLMEVSEVTDEGIAFNARSKYLRGLLLGKKRNAAGELV